MDTLPIFLFIFGITGFCIWWLLRFSKDRYGKNPPLKIIRVYRSDVLEYFTRADHLISYAFGAFVVVLAFLFIKPTISQSTAHTWTVYLLIFFQVAFAFTFSATA